MRRARPLPSLPRVAAHVPSAPPLAATRAAVAFVQSIEAFRVDLNKRDHREKETALEKFKGLPWEIIKKQDELKREEEHQQRWRLNTDASFHREVVNRIQSELDFLKSEYAAVYESEYDGHDCIRVFDDEVTHDLSYTRYMNLRKDYGRFGGSDRPNELNEARKKYEDGTYRKNLKDWKHRMSTQSHY